ncbi:capsular polysaccharide biosynthesis protein [Evansella vedderi]|uniref:Capsular polysaccharide biosynthesis protein n=1 Tax=Evansella vedderi TaxID=38282 RepID=A0ABT9ZQY8_9BACI|nr:Wzz/FepE/Etk N-terminal domain-containing protein [Evansella vedderi]MDQ0253151.1 capsular polysaccharide biosynthesis protein [Evansella vedderi]
MEQARGKEIEIKKLVTLFKKRLWIILLITVAAGAAGKFYVSYTEPAPIYSSSSRIIIHESSGFMDTLLVFIREKPVMEGVIEELELGISPEALSRQIQVNRVGSSQIIEISAINPNPELATVLANTVPIVFMEQVKEVFNYRNVDMLSEAVVSSNPQPINPPSNRMFHIAIVFGLVVGVGFVFLLDSLDNTLRSEREIEKLLGIPVVGSVSKIKKAAVGKKKEKKVITIRTEVGGEVIDNKDFEEKRVNNS